MINEDIYDFIDKPDPLFVAIIIMLCSVLGSLVVWGVSESSTASWITFILSTVFGLIAVVLLR